MCNTVTQKEDIGGEDKAFARLREFVRLNNYRRELDEKLTVVKSQIAGLEVVIRDDMETSGIQSFNVDGLTVYLHRQLWASAKDLEALAQFADTAEFVRPRVLAQTISAYVRELPVDDEGMPVLPKQIKDAVNVTEKFSVRTRKA